MKKCKESTNVSGAAVIFLYNIWKLFWVSSVVARKFLYNSLYAVGDSFSYSFALCIRMYNCV